MHACILQHMCTQNGSSRDKLGKTRENSSIGLTGTAEHAHEFANRSVAQSRQVFLSFTHCFLGPISGTFMH